MPLPLISGICRYCRCTEENACRLASDTCCWIDATRTVCSAPGCVRAEMTRRRAETAARTVAGPRSKYVGWGRGAIDEDKARLRRNARQRQRRGRRKG